MPQGGNEALSVCRGIPTRRQVTLTLQNRQRDRRRHQHMRRRLIRQRSEDHMVSELEAAMGPLQNIADLQQVCGVAVVERVCVRVRA